MASVWNRASHEAATGRRSFLRALSVLDGASASKRSWRWRWWASSALLAERVQYRGGTSWEDFGNGVAQRYFSGLRCLPGSVATEPASPVVVAGAWGAGLEDVVDWRSAGKDVKAVRELAYLLAANS